MYQQQSSNHADMQSLYSIEDIIIGIDLATQKAISLVKLGVSRKEAFAETFALIDEAEKILGSISDETFRIIARDKIVEAMQAFETTLGQIN